MDGHGPQRDLRLELDRLEHKNTLKILKNVFFIKLKGFFCKIKSNQPTKTRGKNGERI